MSDDILTQTNGSWGQVSLTRPKALNSLTRQMAGEMDQCLATWAADPEIKAVLVEGEGGRSFCAGGDIRWLAETTATDPDEAATFFRVEYPLNVRIHRFAKPYVALMDGITMGGGVGISLAASHRIVTERTIWAMPECVIGIIPDVGASWLFPRLPKGLGLYLGLTGARLKAADLIEVGLATHFVPAEKLDDVRAGLLELDLTEEAATRIDSYLEGGETPPEGSLRESLPEIADLFGDVSSVSDLIVRLEKSRSPLAKSALEMMAPASPTSLALTHRMLIDPPTDFADCISLEFDILRNILKGHDFREGVRAQIIDKDRNPKWSPATLDAVDPLDIESYFVPLDDERLDLSKVVTDRD